MSLYFAYQCCIYILNSQPVAMPVFTLHSSLPISLCRLEPLLNEIVKNPATVAMGQLDYINSNTFKYEFYEDYKTRYGFRWDMQFFETFFRPDQKSGKKETDPLP